MQVAISNEGPCYSMITEKQQQKNITCVWFVVYFVSTSYRYIRCDEIVLLPITFDCRQGVRQNFMKGQGVRVRIKVKNHWTKCLRLFFVPNNLVMLFSVYQTNTGHGAVGLYNESNAQKNLYSNVEVVMLLTLCTNFQVFAHFALQSSPMKLYFWYLSCKHFPEITHQYILFAPLFLHLKHFETSALLCVVKRILLNIGLNLRYSGADWGCVGPLAET